MIAAATAEAVSLLSINKRFMKLAPPISMGCRVERNITNVLSTTNAYIGANIMRRYVLILGLLIASSASAQAATLHRHDTGHGVFIAAPVSSTRHDDGRWDPWGHRGTYYGPMIAAPI